MADDEEPKRRKAPSDAQPERPVAEREALTVTVVEPAVSHETVVRVPHDTAQPPPRPTRIPVPRWYWVLFGVALALVYIDYRTVWAARIKIFLEHRVLPPRVVRMENSVWRHTFGGPKEKKGAGGSGAAD